MEMTKHEKLIQLKKIIKEMWNLIKSSKNIEYQLEVNNNIHEYATNNIPVMQYETISTEFNLKVVVQK